MATSDTPFDVNTSPRWVCTACGKWSEDRLGHSQHRTHGWDVSCYMHAVWCRPATAKEAAAKDVRWIHLAPPEQG